MEPTPPTDEWVVVDDRPLDADVAEAAAVGQESLRAGMALLRDVQLPYPDSGGPLAAIRWIATGGTPHPSGEQP